MCVRVRARVCARACVYLHACFLIVVLDQETLKSSFQPSDCFQGHLRFPLPRGDNILKVPKSGLKAFLI